MARLQTANIPLIDDTEDSSSGSSLKYHKSLVIDQTKVITDSANLTSSGLHDDAGRPSSRGNEQIKRGIEIRLVADLGFASRPFTEVLDLLGVSLPDHTCKVEAGISRWIKPSEASAPRTSPMATSSTTSSP